MCATLKGGCKPKVIKNNSPKEFYTRAIKN
jgi:hypothetical protein